MELFKNYKRKRAVKKFVKSIDKNYKCYSSNHWSSLWTQNKIWYSFKKCEGDREYVEYIKKVYGFTPDSFIISLLHEIGHLKTETQELSDERAIIYASLQWAYENNIISYTELFEKSLETPAEILATQWAVDYYLAYKNHLNIFLLSQELYGGKYE